MRYVSFLFLIWAGAASAQMRIIPHVTRPDGGFATRLILNNPSAAEQTITFMPFTAAGTLKDLVSFTLAGHATQTLTTDALGDGEPVSHLVVGNETEMQVTVVYQDAQEVSSPAHIPESDTQAVRWRVYPGTLPDVVDGVAVVNVDDQTQEIWVRRVTFDGRETDRQPVFTLAPKAKDLYLLANEQDAYYELFSEGPLALTALRFSTGEAKYFWQTAAVALPALPPPDNAQPVITGQTALTVEAGMALEVLPEHLTVTDPDNTWPDDFSLTVGDGADYQRSGHTVTPDAAFTGLLMVPVTVNDGTSDSAVYQLEITVTAPGNPAIGKVAVLSPNSTYGVSGRAVIADEHTIRLEAFNYNGGGPDVRVYLGLNGDYANGIIISGTLSGTVFQNETVTFPIPEGYGLDDFNGISIWCTAFSISFSDGMFE